MVRSPARLGRVQTSSAGGLWGEDGMRSLRGRARQGRTQTASNCREQMACKFTASRPDGIGFKRMLRERPGQRVASKQLGHGKTCSESKGPLQEGPGEQMECKFTGVRQGWVGFKRRLRGGSQEQTGCTVFGIRYGKFGLRQLGRAECG